MKYVIVPVKDEGNIVKDTIEILDKTMADKILIVLNGSGIETLSALNDIDNSKLDIVYFNEALGYDVPRSVGAYYAYTGGASDICFVDGDMSHINEYLIDEIFYRLEYDALDLLLVESITNSGINKEKNILASFISQFNNNLDIFDDLGYASPSIGPHGISRSLIKNMGFYPLSVPPLTLAISKIMDLNISAPINIPIDIISTNIRDESHSRLILDTIIGDCIYSWKYYNNKNIDMIDNRGGYIGYHNSRRLDILDFLTSP